MVRLMRTNHLPVYFKKPGVKQLYGHDQIRFSEKEVEISFRFEITDYSFRYTAISRMDGEEIPLLKKRRFILLSS